LDIAFVEAVQTIDEGTVKDLLRSIPAGLGESIAKVTERGDGIQEGLIKTGDEEAGLEALRAQDCELAQSYPLDGEDLLLVDRLVDGKGGGLKAGELVLVFDVEDGVALAAEAVFPGVLGRACLAFRGARAG
jgi:hypothetical protein